MFLLFPKAGFPKSLTVFTLSAATLDMFAFGGNYGFIFSYTKPEQLKR